MTAKVDRSWLLVAVAVVGISTSAPVSAATAAPVLAIAFWRNLVGAGVSGVWLVATGLRARRSGPAAPPASAGPDEPGRIRPGRIRPGRITAGRVRRAAVLAGLLLAVHFVTWLSGLRLSTVTASTALVSTTPVWTVGFDLVRRRAVPRAVLLGVALAMAGVVVITGVDAARSGPALAGDLLSLAGAVAGAGYVAVGDVVMRSASAASYTLHAYGTCAAVLLPVALLDGAPVTGFAARTWVELGVVTVGAQLLGHTLLNVALPKVGVTPLALAILLEIPGAALVAWVWLGQVPPAGVVPGAVLMLTGLVVVVRARARTAVSGGRPPGPGRRRAWARSAAR
jgi:drug/metabolite transporter (DMT)-like permease